ncbi:MAG: helix-turn-helix transcriptional regulator [Vicinamibacterales bacterium]
MPDQEQFGPRLRRERERRGISLDDVADATKVSIDLWDGLERNDVSRWPSGIFARAFVRDYALTVGLDADAVVDEFCRHFSIADRRTTRIVEAQAALIGHNLTAVDPDPLPAGRERRRERRQPERETLSLRAQYAPRLMTVGIDLVAVSAVSLAIAAPTSISFWKIVGPAAAIYYTASTVMTGVSPGGRVVAALRLYAPALFAASRRPTLVR